MYLCTNIFFKTSSENKLVIFKCFFFLYLQAADTCKRDSGAKESTRFCSKAFHCFPGGSLAHPFAG